MKYQHKHFSNDMTYFLASKSSYLNTSDLIVTMNTEYSLAISNLPELLLSVNYLLRTVLLTNILLTVLSLDQGTLG